MINMLSLIGILALVVGCASAPHVSNAWLEIDSRAFESNVRTLQATVGAKTKVCAVMKADAYGHGLALLMPSLISLGISCIAITSNDEARTVRDAGFKGELIRIRAATPDEVVDALPLDLEELVGSLAYARLISQLAVARSRDVRFHLSLNATGMSRDGIDLRLPDGKTDALALLKLPRLHIVGIMTHFPVEGAEDVRRVLAVFKSEADWVIKEGALDRASITLHCANSFATLEVPESRLDLVRPGGALFGDTVPSHTEYRRVMAFKSRVAAVNRYTAGNTVSYDRTYTLKNETALANIPTGYSNGYRRIFSNVGHALIRGRRFAIVGRVTMNTFLVDITGHPEIQPGDEVVLFGKQGSAEITQAEIEKETGSILADLYTVWGYSNPKILK